MAGRQAGRQAAQRKNVHYILSAYALWIFGAGKRLIYICGLSLHVGGGREREWEFLAGSGSVFRCIQGPDGALTLSGTLSRPLPAPADTPSI